MTTTDKKKEYMKEYNRMRMKAEATKEQLLAFAKSILRSYE
jgi:hypothetical protein